ncbi:MAG: hypothetical protein AAF589_04630 [Planctomycetota bacterium]
MTQRPATALMPWRLAFVAGVVLLCLIAVVARAGETYDLTATPNAADAQRVSIELELGGKLLAKEWSLEEAGNEEGKEQAVPVNVTAHLVYDERTINARRSVRWYQTAEATIQSGAGVRAPRLPASKRLIVADQAATGRATLRASDIALTRTELDLVDIVGDARALDLLLPGESLEKGGEWQAADTAMAALLGLDTVSVCDVKGVLDSGNKRYARFQLAGVVHGVVDAATTEFDVRAIGLFDRNPHQVTQLNLAMPEKRAIGPATPGLEATAKAKIKRTPAAPPSQLIGPAIEAIADATPSDALVLQARRQGFRVAHGRDWFLTGEAAEAVTLRRIDATGLTAQTTLKQLPPKAESRLPTPEKFQQEIQYSLGDAFEHLVSSEQWTNPAGCRVMGLVVRGKAKGVPLEWRYYLAMPPAPAEEEGADEQGANTEDTPRHMVSVVTTVEQALVKRVGKADRKLVDAVELVKPQKSSDTIAQAEAPAAKPSTPPTTKRRRVVRTAKKKPSTSRRQRGSIRRR